MPSTFYITKYISYYKTSMVMNTVSGTAAASVQPQYVDHTLSVFAADLDCSSLPEPSRKTLKRLFLDTIGVALGAGAEAHSRQALAYARLSQSAPLATLWGAGERVAPAEAAFANGVAAHGRDFDDTHRFVHPGCSIVPAALAVAEWQKSSGEALLAALAAGYETSIRVAYAGGAAHRARGFHPTGTCNVFGAAVAAAKLLRLDAIGIKSAIGLASSMASGLTQYRFDGAANKHMHGGLAAQHGVQAALLASLGMQGTNGGLDGDQGFLEVCADRNQVHVITDALGEKFLLNSTDIKPYPSCRQSHASIDLALEIRNRHGISPQDISSIEIRIYTYAEKDWYVSREAPNSSLEAMLRIPYCVSVALTHGRVSLAEFEADVLRDRDILDLQQKIQVFGDANLDANWPQERAIHFTVQTQDGRRLSLVSKNPRGGSDNPLSDEEVFDKFIGTSAGRLSPPQQEDLIDLCWHLDRQPDLDRLCRLLAAPEPHRQ